MYHVSNFNLQVLINLLYTASSSEMVKDPEAGGTTSVPVSLARTTLMVYVYSTPGVRLVNVTVCWKVDEEKVVVVGPS